MEKELDFKKLSGLIPCVVQDADTDKVLMVGFMNEEALSVTKQKKQLTFYSRSKKRLWTKGETSGNFIDVVSLQPDCDNDTLLIKARPRGPVCHTGADTCFQERNLKDGVGFLEEIIRDRQENPQSGSYTNSLIDGGINKVAQKVGEEAIELVIEAKDSNDKRFLDEAADLMYHYLVLLAVKGHTHQDVVKVLQARHWK